MKTKYLSLEDLEMYRNDIEECYHDNPQIFDLQCSINPKNFEEVMDMLRSFVVSEDSMIEGVFDSEMDYLFGLIIFDSIRLTDDGNSAEVHICICKDMWGKVFYPVYERMIKDNLFDTLYAMIPSCCRGAITLCKKLGFKKTGYVPKSLPYTNLKGEIKMYDTFIFSLQKELCCG